MKSTRSRGVLSVAAVFLAVWAALVAGCSSPAAAPPAESVAKSKAALGTSNGFTQNGLSTNGFTQNGFTQNGFTQNGFTQNGFTQNGFTQNGFTQNGLTAMDILEADPNAIDFVKYAYSCAMRPDQSLTLTINGVDHTFTGQLGLAPEWGLDGGSCNQACQRWVSACMLARVNAYGVKVNISLRAPAFAAGSDEDTRTKLLALGPTEAADFPLREGAYYGNIFAGALQSDGTATNAPQYNACAGPASNIPQLTKRFCSSQGEPCIIFTGQDLWSTCTETNPACAGLDPDDGAVENCVGHDGLPYEEVLTVYLAQPIAVCGNGVCEGSQPGAIYAPDSPPEDFETCPDDCHPGTWANGIGLHQIRCTVPGRCFDPNQFGLADDFGRRLATGVNDTAVRVLDIIQGSSGNVDFGTSVLSPALGSTLATYKSTGSPAFAQFLTVDPSGAPSNVRSVATDKDGNIFVASNDPLRVAKFTPAGAFLWVNTFPNVISGIAGPLATDAAGDVAVAYVQPPIIFFEEGTAAAPTLGTVTVSKLHGTDGSFEWTVPLDPVDPNLDITDGAMSIDAGGTLHLTDDANLYSIDSTGTPLWTRGALSFGIGVRFTGVAADASGASYVSGLGASTNFTGTTTEGDGGAGSGPGGFVVRFAPDGSLDLGFTPYFVPGNVSPIDLHLDADGNVIVAGGFTGDGSSPDFGAGPFDSWGSADTFVAARSSADGGFLWAKQLSLISSGGLDGLALGAHRQVYLSGGFDGSMVLDGFQLINENPGLVNTQDLFVGAFAAPCTTPGCDVLAPVFDAAHIPSTGSDVGSPIVVYATSTDGAEVEYTSLTARNAGDDHEFGGVNIVCSPRSGSVFPIGVTTVSCTASDAHGNHSVATFPVTVLGTVGPAFLNVPADITVDATSAAGAVVTYTLPKAVDQVDGEVPVTCTPPSGSVFHVGPTVVTCTAADRANPPNVTHASFNVNVRFRAPPVITVPGPIVADATSPAGAIVKYKASAKDALGASIPVTCLPPSGSLFPLRITTVHCTAVDATGSSASASFTVQVRYKWFGFLPPVKNDGSASFKLGSTIPVIFQLSPGITTAVANLTLAKVVGGVPGPEQNAVSTTGANQGNFFRFDRSCNGYIFDLSTKPLSKGTWRLRVDLHDGVAHTVNITLK